MQQGGEFGRFYEDGRSTRARRPATGSGRRAAGDARGPAHQDILPKPGRSRLRREIQQALGSRTALRRALLLREILGPPRSLQVTEDAQARPSEGPQPGDARTPQNGQHQNGVSTGEHRNGHSHLPPSIPEDRASRVALPPAPPEPVVSGPVASEPTAAAQPPESGTSSPPEMASDGPAGAIRRFFRRMGIRL